ncbi:phospholipid scramblase 2-like [Gouania willdenowi]|nr:phospholipid scramblase 2-like [Gouania willdenowi]XP_028330102.1 phospholipid scramblase 2-like [Gouania willdenowi]XP_028330103.1 phospholipid scramblase 2-like [Gouania willdenowi]XP_028330104.1 phospholipid scramblase 2-like [Gouania willdenowi]XP_028330105.1 phospholipid scramblase 2-like [Gouania willdenowi]XP_028330106.1 phospholipid scramblase 2-like [Gouania willdenowi]XP_028330107.1 phospholipid scramblase 2-like [Gouania willdenowi]
MPHPGERFALPYNYSAGYSDLGQDPPPSFDMHYNMGPPPIMFQPSAVVPASPPAGITPAPDAPHSMVPIGVPPGLEYLAQIDHIQIHQKVELVKASVGFDMKNQYKIKNSQGQKIYKAKEENDYCTKNCCGSLRSFVMKISDYSDREVIRLIRPFRCMSCCCPCCLQEMEVQAPPGTTIGYVKQDWHPFLPKVSIQGPNKETLMKIEGPCCVSYCCGDVNYELKTNDSDEAIGLISKQWSGVLKEVFPLDLDVKMKAVLLGACFLIDFMFFGAVRPRSIALSSEMDE